MDKEDKVMETEVNDMLSIDTIQPDAPPEVPPETTPEVPPVVPEPAPAAPDAQPKAPDAPDAPEAPVQTPMQDAPATQPMPPTPPAGDAKDAQIAEMAATIAALQKMVEDTARQAIATTPVQKEEPPKVGADGKPIEVPPEVMFFLTKEEDLDKALNSVENFNSLLTGVVRKAQESVLTSIPLIVSRLADQMVTQKLAVNEFYANNKDLVENKAFVGMVANDIAAKNPDWDMAKVIENLGTEVRSRLRLNGSTSIVPQVLKQPSQDPPAFVPGALSRPGGTPPVMGKMEQEIADLISEM